MVVEPVTLAELNFAREPFDRRSNGCNCHLGHRTAGSLACQHDNRSSLVELCKADFTHVSPQMRRGLRSTPRESRDRPLDLRHSRLRHQQVRLAASSPFRERGSRDPLGFRQPLQTRFGLGTSQGRREDARIFAPSCLQPTKTNPNVGCAVKCTATATKQAQHTEAGWDAPTPCADRAYAVPVHEKLERAAPK